MAEKSKSGAVPETAPTKVKVRVAPRNVVVVDPPHPVTGFHAEPAQPGDIIELDAKEAERLKKRGIVQDLDEKPAAPVQPEGLHISAEDGPRPIAQGPDFSRA